MGLCERLAQGLDLGQLELAVAALGALGHRVAEPPLPAAQCVGADAQHLGGGISADRTHE